MPHVIDGSLLDWTNEDRLDRPGTGTAGYQLYGTFENGQYVFAINSPITIGLNTTIWLNTDRNITTGKQAFGGTADTGAEYYINVTSEGIPVLYNAANVVISQSLAFQYSLDKKSLEVAIPMALMGQATAGLDVKMDVNDGIYLPSPVVGNTMTVKDPALLPVVDATPLKIGIVYSETSAARYFGGTDAGKMAYSQLFMAAQNQATAAGVPFDVLTEADLKNLSKVAGYDAIVFPSFTNVKSADVAQIQDVLTDAVYKYHVGLITAGEFMTNNENGVALPDAYARMQSLLDLTREGGTTTLGGDPVQIVANVGSDVFPGYQANEVVRDYAKMSTSWYKSADGTPVTPIATQKVTEGNATTEHAAVVGTQTGGRNVHFANESLLGDNNMLQHAIDYVVKPAAGPSLSLHMSRDKAIVASRTDMDQAMETADVSPESGAPGIYDKLLPILDEWKKDYNFVGSYYIDIGTDPANGQTTNWAVSKPYYDALLAAGNEIGSHSMSHPENTNLLTPERFQAEFETSRNTISQQLGITVKGAAIPGAPEFLPASIAIEKYYDYITGGATLVGAGYPGAIGHLLPDDPKVYIAPNMSFDFTLVGFQRKTAAEASIQWQNEFKSLTAHSDQPIVVWPWHDYGPTNWVTDENLVPGYTKEMFTDLIKTAYDYGSEFVTLADLAQRVASFDATNYHYSFNATANSVTATVASADAGKFALDLSGLAADTKIKSVANWYAYDSDSVFVAKTGGTYTINLGNGIDDVTHLYDVTDRAELTSVTGDGSNLSFSVVGEGKFLVDLRDPSGGVLTVTSAAVGDLTYSVVGDKLAITLAGLGAHTVNITLTGGAQPQNRPFFGDVSYDPHSAAGEVYALYDAVLHRPSDADGQQYWTGLHSSGLSLHDMAQTFLDSAEGRLNLGSGSNQSFVEALYLTALDRAGDAPGVQWWTGVLDQGMSRADAVLGFAFSAENLAGLQSAYDRGIFTADADAGDAARLYHTLLDRAPDASGLQYWSGALKGGVSDADAAQSFFASSEYQTKYAGLTDAAFVDMLYQNALGRQAESAGHDYWTGVLTQGGSRATVAASFAESQEAHQHLMPFIETGWHLA
ncbi:DUF4214 domain-containing protein [Methylobacterium oxalidis]|uniref:Chitooligosaccharide deacetylase n=1 Tax=Methylobacterium oxalidis TaxID=944322 RepID=A0A512J7Z3_9HYPH|nr:DUF4214 domain-containing protein [Methylobacterium oxalidis]GEP06081.1 hypothetical protein MOX02_41190 [Methylobacterium oxalidis]GJE31829.1 hypothetical protein LDDCCGHA_2011 [Methylobacterium oxalidis]GLS64273.1 hypothetical protein GCM10007888_26540 [Methylobacterium oxalidis]